MNRIKKFEQINENKKSVFTTDDLWVIQSYPGSDISELYLIKEDAEKEANRLKEEYRKHYRDLHKDMSDDEFKEYYDKYHHMYMFEVKTLDDAIFDIKNNSDEEYLEEDY